MLIAILSACSNVPKAVPSKKWSELAKKEGLGMDLEILLEHFRPPANKTASIPIFYFYLKFTYERIKIDQFWP
ncbi:hypothetical protein AO498_08740 [Algoriphagus sanaruensis]|uniref:Uncharacterized protein n=1 Tax=Algoriphagus sanaruensis TaxID=1727163 RepID=A0A142EMZ7_9BACT|nr:hypothetical protein AO498_08740 [Algoriphagus sanaruensis]